MQNNMKNQSLNLEFLSKNSWGDWDQVVEVEEPISIKTPIEILNHYEGEQIFSLKEWKTSEALENFYSVLKKSYLKSIENSYL